MEVECPHPVALRWASVSRPTLTPIETSTSTSGTIGPASISNLSLRAGRDGTDRGGPPRRQQAGAGGDAEQHGQNDDEGQRIGRRHAVKYARHKLAEKK